MVGQYRFLAKSLQHMGKLHQEVEAVFKLFEGQEDFWLRRIAITLQLGFKEQTDVALLERAIDADRSTKEFFIQKAIGWALRDYSKTNPLWVKRTIDKRIKQALQREKQVSIYREAR